MTAAELDAMVLAIPEKDRQRVLEALGFKRTGLENNELQTLILRAWLLGKHHEPTE